MPLRAGPIPNTLSPRGESRSLELLACREFPITAEECTGERPGSSNRQDIVLLRRLVELITHANRRQLELILREESKKKRDIREPPRGAVQLERGVYFTHAYFGPFKKEIRMTLVQAQHLLKLARAGYRIKWDSSPYVDGFASVSEAQDRTIIISSHVFAETLLITVHVNEIRVYKPIEEWIRHEP